MADVKQYIISKFPGFATSPEPQSVKDGVVVGGLNWMFSGGDRKNGADKVELRRGYRLLGTDAGVGQVSGLRKGTLQDGTELLFKTYARKILYFDTATDDWIEVGSDSLPLGASGEEIAIDPYTSLAGYAIYFSSPNSSIYKIMLANPATLIDMSSTSFRGRMKIRNGRMFLWNRLGTGKAKDETGLYGSKLDKDTYSDYTTVSAEAIGSSGSTHYSGTLAFKAGGAKRSCFGVTFTDGTLILSDDFNGAIVGDGSGTINYATGEYDITFDSATTGSVTSTYYYEDPTSGGIADFAYSSTRVAGEGFVLRQDDGGGKLQNIGHYNNDYYCIHEKKSWKVSLSSDDLTASNLPYRELLGTQNWRGVIETDMGVFVINTAFENSSDVQATKISIEPLGTAVLPSSVSDVISFEKYRFDKAVLFNWGDFVCFACRTDDATQNNRLFLYNTRLGLWNPPHDLQASVLEVYNGALIGGDSTTNNAYELYSGVDDDDSKISDNFVTFNISKAGVEGLKKARRLVIEGEIQIDQKLEVWASFDRGEFVLLDTILGNGSYVDIGSDIGVGLRTLGSTILGSGDAILANHYKKDVKINTDKFEEIQLKFKAVELGYVSVSLYGLRDLRWKGEKSMGKYIVN
jgi:hypothetical protein